jgi:hypothetical protein
MESKHSHSNSNSNSNWKELLEITFLNTNSDAYVKNIYTKAKRAVVERGWKAETLIQAFRSAHENGYFGFHILEGFYPNIVIETIVQKICANQDYFSARYCQEHKKMLVFIDPRKLQLNEKQCMQKYSMLENDGKPIYDFCFDFDFGPLPNPNPNPNDTKI